MMVFFGLRVILWNRLTARGTYTEEDDMAAIIMSAEAFTFQFFELIHIRLSKEFPSEPMLILS